MTQLVLERIVCAEQYTHGELLWTPALPGQPLAEIIELHHLAAALEDKDRGLDAADPSTFSRKLYAETAIPITDPLKPYLVSYRHSPSFNREMPYIDGIPTHTDVMFHGGNTVLNTKGCPLLGAVVSNGRIPDGQSRVAVVRFNAWLRSYFARTGNNSIPLHVRYRRSNPRPRGFALGG